MHKMQRVRNRFQCSCGWRGTQRIEPTIPYWTQKEKDQYLKAVGERLEHKH